MLRTIAMFCLFVATLLSLRALGIINSEPPHRIPEAQTEHTPCDAPQPIGSLLQHIDRVSVDGQDWYVFRCAGWEYGALNRSVQELLITFDPKQKEPSPRCWISKPQTEQRITALHLEFASPAQLQNMLTLSPTP